METVKPNVFAYSDYRLFLRDQFGYLKTRQKGFSIRKFAKESGVSNGYFTHILNNNQPVSQKTLVKMLSRLELEPGEQAYIKDLCVISDSKSQDKKIEALERIKKLKSFQKTHPKQSQTYEYLSKWYHVAIREMSALPNFRLDPKWIRDHLKKPVPLGEIRKAIDFLIQNKFIEINSDGSVKAPNVLLSGEGDVFRTAQAAYHNQTLALASDSIQSTPREERNVVGYAIAIDTKNFDEYRKILDKAMNELMMLNKKDLNRDAVYHFAFLGFPLSKKEGQG